MNVTSLGEGQVAGGVDTHQDLHVAAVVDHTGKVLGTKSFPTTRHGYLSLITWMRSLGDVARVGVECTGSYGAGLTRYLGAVNIPTLEVTRPDKSLRRAQGKSDDYDAIAAALAALYGQRVQVAKDRSGQVEALRVLRTTRKTAIKCRRATLQQLHNTIVAASDKIREQYRGETRMHLLRKLATSRPTRESFRDPDIATQIALKSLAKRVLELNDEIADLDELIEKLVKELAGPLLELPGMGVDSAGEFLVAAGDNPERLGSEASFAMMCGACPIPASSGKTNRHRLNRGGNRQANSALHIVVLSRIRMDERTQAYVTRRLAEGLSKREVMRCLKRYVAREVYHVLVNHKVAA
ncbi:IS110 family transposase [Ferrimicrobium acidiphilum]|uniref:IS110 family transposase n=1 Tax=Ferrimicrobium acidiphilum TaxID=121039 RepID=A0ABV3Y5X2_9ACTN